MPLRYLLDTNICIYIAKHRPQEVLKRFQRLQPGEAAMSVITQGELRYGACKSRYRNETQKILEELTTLIPVLALHEHASDCYGKIRAELEKSGQVIGNNDLWIASHALALGVALVTNNENEFRWVRGLVVRNWIREDGTPHVHERPPKYRSSR
jgi:tRNA(fMet)-specific endonuclease VapC